MTAVEGAQFSTAPRPRARRRPFVEGPVLDVALNLPPEVLAVYAGVGVLAGFLGGLLGVGGGLVIVPALIWANRALGIDQAVGVHLAVGTSLATIVMTSLSSIWAHQRRGAVLWPLVGRISPGIVAGSWAGALLAERLSSAWLQRVFAGFVLAIGVRMFFGGTPKAHRGLPGLPGLSAVGTLIGLISALVGIGGGSLTVPFLTWCSVSMRNAVATSSACGLPIALAGTMGFVVAGWGDPRLPPAATGYVYWPAFVGVAVASVGAAPVGAWAAHALPVGVLRRVFAALLLGVGLKMVL